MIVPSDTVRVRCDAAAVDFAQAHGWLAALVRESLAAMRSWARVAHHTNACRLLCCHAAIAVRHSRAVISRIRSSAVPQRRLGLFWSLALSQAYPGPTAVLIDEFHAGLREHLLDHCQ